MIKKDKNFLALRNMSDTLEKRFLFMGLLTKEMAKYNIKPVIIGGNAVEFYTAGGYTTSDIDIVCSDYERLNKILKSWGFKKEGRHWFNKEIDILIESPASILNGSRDRISEVEMKGYKIYVEGIEDIIIDRLNAYVHWHSQDDFDWAKQMIVLNKGRIDWDYLIKRTKEEKVERAFNKLKLLGKK